MKKSIRPIVWIPSILTGFFFSMIIGARPALPADLGKVEKILGVSGQMQEGAMVFSFPRHDLKIGIGGDAVPTALGFGSWTAWREMGGEVMVMGDLVLLQQEINSVISALAEANVNITALHNHFLGENPRLMYMHIYGMGQAAPLAFGIRNALNKTATPQPGPGAGGTSQPALLLNPKPLEQIIGHLGKTGGGVFRITIGRPGVKMGGVEMTASMGLNTWVAFAGDNERAHVAGDVAMTSKEVNPVIRSLRRGGIEITAVHNHMLNEDPRIFFLHYWGTGPAEKLAKTLREGFDQAQGPLR